MRRTAVLNRSQSSRVLKVVTELDAFPKVPDNFKQTSASGGGISVLTFIFIAILVISELQYYTSTQLEFDYGVDTEVEGKIKINIDMTVAMRCELIGADVLDQTGQDTSMTGQLELTNVHYELSPRQRRYHDITQHINNYMREEYHAVQELLWLSGHQTGLQHGMPEREDKPTTPVNACRIHGSVEVKKVAGNFHVTAGKSFPTFRGHVHITGMVDHNDYNFSHRIDHFSFGERSGGKVNPLDAEEQITTNNYHLFQYFMKIVPTEVRTYANNIDTYQFSVTERNRSIDHTQGSHGVPGIFVKYDLSFLKIRVREEHKPYWKFLVRLCGIVGGVFVVSGLLHDSVGGILDLLCCRFKLGKYAKDNFTKTETLLMGDPNNPVSYRNPQQNSSNNFSPIDLVQDSHIQDSHIPGSVGLVAQDNIVNDR